MSNDSLEEEILAICRRILNDESVTLTDSFRELSTWDSLSLAELMVAIEMEFSVELSVDEMRSISKPSDIVTIVVNRVA